MGRSYGRIDPATGHDYMRVEGDTTPCDEQQIHAPARAELNLRDGAFVASARWREGVTPSPRRPNHCDGVEAQDVVLAQI